MQRYPFSEILFADLAHYFSVLQRMLTDPTLHSTCVMFVGCKRHLYDSMTNAQLQQVFTLLSQYNKSVIQQRKRSSRESNSSSHHSISEYQDCYCGLIFIVFASLKSYSTSASFDSINDGL